MKKFLAMFAAFALLVSPALGAELDIDKTMAQASNTIDFWTNCGDCETDIELNIPERRRRQPMGDPLLIWDNVEAKGDLVEQKSAIGSGYTEFVETTSAEYAEGLASTSTHEETHMKNKRSSSSSSSKEVDDGEMDSSSSSNDKWYKGSKASSKRKTSSQWNKDSEQSSVSSSASIQNSGFFLYQKDIAFDGESEFQK